MADPETTSPETTPEPPSEASPGEGEAEPCVPEPTLDPAAKICGNCRLFKLVLADGGSWKGDCKLMPDRGLFPPTAPPCNKFLPRAAPIPRALPKDPIRAERRPSVAPTVRKPDVPIPELMTMTREELKAVLREALEETSEVRLAPRWEGGTLVMKPCNPALQAKELPIDALFHKVVMVRDRLRTLEQKVNAHPKLSDADKVEMQQHITRCYGSLTTFNLLFSDKADQFVGEKGKGE